MLDSIRGFVTRRILSPPGAPADPGSSGPSGVQLAACARLLELAHADGVMSPSELLHIERAIQRHFELDEATARELIALAEAERRQSIDHFHETWLVRKLAHLLELEPGYLAEARKSAAARGPGAAGGSP